MGRYYKVIRVRYDGLYSSLAAFGKAQVFYSKDIWAYPPTFLKEMRHGLFVFDSLKNALKTYKNCIKNGVIVEMWECEVGEILPLPTNLYLGFLSRGEVTLSNLAYPPGTVCVEKVKLTQKICGSIT